MKWENGSIMIRGQDVPVKTGMIAHMDLKYFTDNPRIYSVVRVDGAIPSQDEIQSLLWKMDHVKELLSDIKENGGLIDPIIVKDGNLEVLEGNSRLAAYRKLAEGGDIKWDKIKCTFLPKEIEESQVFSLLGQYHINGKKGWTPYEQAGFLYRRYKEHKLTISDLGKELGMGEKKAETLIETYQLMIDNNDTDVARWSYYYEYHKSGNIRKFRSEYSGFHKVVLTKIKSGEIDHAADIRKLAKIPVTKQKIIKDFVAGNLTIDDAFDRAEASGSTDMTYNKIKKFREWFGSEGTQSALESITHEAHGKIDLELRRLAKDTKRLQGFIRGQK